MLLKMTPDKRNLAWVTVGLTATFAFIVALIFRPSLDSSPTGLDFLYWEGAFAGPLVIASLLSLLLARAKARIILLGFGVAYSILAALMFGWTFGFEHDAQYQLALLAIPLVGFPSIIVAGLAAAVTR